MACRHLSLPSPAIHQFINIKAMNNLRDISTRWPSHIAENFVPTSYWTEDADGNYVLHLHLPGFKSEEVRIEQPSTDQIKIGGERIVNDKCIYIDQTFSLPENSSVDDIIGRFEDEHLQILVPKKSTEENEEDKGNETWNSTAEESPQEESNFINGEHQRKQVQRNDDDKDDKKKRKGDETSGVAGFPEELIKEWEGKENPWEMIIEWIKRNKGIVLSVVLSFSVGMWVSNVWIN